MNKAYRVFRVKQINPFIPEFLQWTLQSLNLDTSISANWDISKKNKFKYETARYEPTRFNLHCFHMFFFFFFFFLVSRAERIKSSMDWIICEPGSAYEYEQSDADIISAI